MKLRPGSLKKVDKINKSLARLTKGNKKEIKSIKVQIKETLEWIPQKF